MRFGRLSLAHANFLAFDFRNATLIYINSICWPPRVLKALSRRFRLPQPGARILNTGDPSAETHSVPHHDSTSRRRLLETMQLLHTLLQISANTRLRAVVETRNDGALSVQLVPLQHDIEPCSVLRQPPGAVCRIRNRGSTPLYDSTGLQQQQQFANEVRACPLWLQARLQPSIAMRSLISLHATATRLHSAGPPQDTCGRGGKEGAVGPSATPLFNSDF